MNETQKRYSGREGHGPLPRGNVLQEFEETGWKHLYEDCAWVYEFGSYQHINQNQRNKNS